MGRDMGPILAKINHLEESNRQLREFARTIVQTAFEGGNWDGGEIQDLAVKRGLLIETTYDPEIHGDADYEIEQGDKYFVFAEVLEDFVLTEMDEIAE